MVGKFNKDTISIDKIHLDPNNPRFGRESIPENRFLEPKVQEQCMDILKGNAKVHKDEPDNTEHRESIDDLYESIKNNGFIPLNNILVKELQNNKGEYIVLEGNRRITTIKTLIEKHDTGEITLDEDVFSSIIEIDVAISTGSSNYDYNAQGISHLIGTKAWKPFSQAKFLHNKMTQEDMTVQEVADSFGYSRARAGNLIKSYFAFLNLKNDPDYGSKCSTSHFSYFEEAFNKPLLYRDRLKWNNTNRCFENTTELKTFYKWFLGDEDGKKRISMAIQLRDIPPILKDDMVKNRFDSGKITLIEAIQELSESEDKNDSESIIKGLRRAYRAIGQITENSIEEFGETIEDLLNKINARAKKHIKRIDSSK